MFYENNRTYTLLSLLSMVDFRRILLGFLPVNRNQPPLMQNQPVFSSTPESLRAEFAPVVEACEREQMQEHNAWCERPCLSQGGDCISDDWLRGISDWECLLQFGYLFLNWNISTGKLTGLHSAQSNSEWAAGHGWRTRNPTINHNNHYVFDSIKALALRLALFHSSGDQCDLSMHFNQSKSSILEILNWVMTHIDKWWQHLPEFYYKQLLSPANLKTDTQAIHHTGAPLTGVWKFIDCTICRICSIQRPQEILCTEIPGCDVSNWHVWPSVWTMGGLQGW